MPTRSGHLYLLEESSKSHTTPMDPQQIVIMFTEINAKLDTLETLDERLTKVECTRDQTLLKNNRRNTENSFNPDTQHLKSIKIDGPNFEGRHDPQFFIDLTLQLNRYFIWYEFIESKKVKYVVMKLSGQASQYWTNLENRRAARVQPLIEHGIG